MDKTIHYICFYADEKSKDYLKVFPSALPKIDYITKTLKDLGFNVQIYSTSHYKKNITKKIVSYHNAYGVLCHYQKPILNYGKFGHSLNILLSWIQIFFYLLFKVKKNDKVLVYHSMFYYLPIRLIKTITKFRFTLEVEELYYSLFQNQMSNKIKEINYVSMADSYLFVNDLLPQKIDLNNKPFIISYSTYTIPKYKSSHFFNDDKIHVVYAGIIERYRNAAFLAANIARYLPESYVIHILGFGDQQDIEALNKEIEFINNEEHIARVQYHEALYGEEYDKFLFSCHIGLSCHTYDETVPESADCTFPSKVVVYLSHNLRVVTLPLRCLEISSFKKFITFSEGYTSLSLAQAVLKVDVTEDYNSRDFIKQLDESFRNNIKYIFR